jgi:hypothetical protein
MSNTQVTNKKSQQKQHSQTISPNPLEALKDIGNATVDQMKQEIMNFPQNFVDGILGGATQPQPNRSGEIVLGDSMEMTEVFSGQDENQVIMRQQIAFERRLLEEEKSQTEKKSNELKIQLKMIQEELVSIAQNTQELAEETEIAAMQTTVNPGVYHVIFFEKLLEFVKSFRKRINEANVWLHSANKRAGKKAKSWVGNYEKHGAKYLLSGEHYAQRSAG